MKKSPVTAPKLKNLSIAYNLQSAGIAFCPDFIAFCPDYIAIHPSQTLLGVYVEQKKHGRTVLFPKCHNYKFLK